MIELISSLVVPLVLCACSFIILFSEKDRFGVFLAGAEKGVKTALSLMPTLIIMCTAASMFSASGAGKYLSLAISPVTELLGIPSEIVPFLIVRPISGSASNSVLSELYREFGADSFPAFTASVIAGSSDTLFYIIAVYFSAVKIKNTRHSVAAGICTMLTVIVLSCFVSRIFF